VLYLNEYEVRDIATLFTGEGVPNLDKAAKGLENLMIWTNQNSDGWAYWKAPLRASEPLMLRLMEAESDFRRGHDLADLSEAQMKLFFKPIRDLLSNLGHDADAILFPPLEDPDVPDGMEGQEAVNWRRGNRAAEALQEYVGSEGYGDEGSEVFEDALLGLLTDLRHLAYRAGVVDFEAINNDASDAYCKDIEMEDGNVES
jgi:hypothetical protein